MMRTTLFIAAAIAGVASLGARAAAQAGDPRQEVKKLFEKVSKDLDEIDKLLLNASNEPRSSDSSKSSAAKDAAKEAHGKQKEVVDSIQKILELVPRTGSQNNGGGGQGQKPEQSGGKLPNDPGQQQEDADTPKGDGQAPQNASRGERPDNPRESKAKPTKGVKPPRDYATERKERGDATVDRWGDLPEQVRQAFSNENTQDLPLRYRKWIEDFFRRAQRSGASAGSGR